MTSGLEISTVVEVLVATGLLSAFTETVRWLTTGRKRSKVDNAAIVQGMAIDLVRPIHDELESVRARLTSLSLELDSVLGYAIIAHALLERGVFDKDGNPVTPPAPPAPVLARKP